MSKPENPATVRDCLQLAHGVAPSELDHIVDLWHRLDQRLLSFPQEAVELRLSIKERDTPSQHTTLEAWIARRDPLVATSNREGYDAALTEVRDDLIRQITDMKNRSEPRKDRRLRERPEPNA
ncbi:MAG: hypothetical protein R2754_17460 [Microthrixaceae bacterium]